MLWKIPDACDIAWHARLTRPAAAPGVSTIYGAKRAHKRIPGRVVAPVMVVALGADRPPKLAKDGLFLELIGTPASASVVSFTELLRRHAALKAPVQTCRLRARTMPTCTPRRLPPAQRNP
jgi:hypothetical protein